MQCTFYIPTSIPTGSSSAPKLAQILAIAIANAATESTSVNRDVFIDNIRFSSGSNVLGIMNKATNICRTIGVTMNDDETVYSDAGVYKFLGVMYDHQKKTVELSDGIKEKLKTIRSKFEAKEMSTTVHDFQSMFGLLSWSSMVVKHHTAQYYLIYKFMRKKCGSKGPDDTVQNWPSTNDVWTNWASNLLYHPKRCVEAEKQKETITIISDASLIGWGGFVFASNLVLAFAGRWHRKHSAREINLLEAKAVLFILKAMKERGMTNQSVKVIVDNTSVQSGLNKGRSRSFKLNCCLLGILKLVRSMGIILTTVEYINTKLNPADFLSRLGRRFAWPL